MGESSFSVKDLGVNSTRFVKGKNDKIIKDFILVFLSNALSLLSGIVTGFLIPNYLGVAEYGNLMVFTFYVTYVSMLQFGYNDGIYIRYGKFDYNALPKEKFRMYFRFLFLSQVVLSIIFYVFIKLMIKDPDRGVIFSFICINATIVNLFSFFSLVNEVTRRFRIYSLSMVLTKLLYVVFTVFLIALGIKSHIGFIAIITAANLLVLVINFFASKEIAVGKGERIKDSMGDIKENILIGIPQLSGNFTIMLIVGTSRFLVDKFLTLYDFAMYSFAFSLISIVYLFIGTLSTVVYPYLARAKKDKRKVLYERMKFLVLVFISMSLTSYFFLKVLIIGLLPSYANALDISLFLFATILFRSQIDVVSRNFYKVMMLQKDYTINVILIFVVGVVIALLSYFVFKSAAGLAVSTVLSFVIWMLHTDRYFMKKLSINLTKLHITEALITTAFLASGILFKWYVGIFLYLISVSAVLMIFCKNDLKQLIKHKLNYLSFQEG